MASVTHEHSPRRAVSMGSMRSSDPSAPTASPTSFHDPSCTEKSRVGLVIVLPPSVHRLTFPRLPSPRPSQMVLASRPRVKLLGDALYSLPNASSCLALIPSTGMCPPFPPKAMLGHGTIYLLPRWPRDDLLPFARARRVSDLS